MNGARSNGRAVMTLALVGLALLLVGCGWAEWPPPGGQARAVNAPPTAKVGASDLRFVGADAVVVGRGDTVHALSRRHRVGVRAIIDANRLTPPYHLRIGQRIVLPRRRTHMVVAGDTLRAIAQSYGTDTYLLALVNDLQRPYAIFVGQRLDLPRGATAATATAAAAAPRRDVKARAKPQNQVVQAPRAVPRPPPATGNGFLWPVKGRVISGFGGKTKGLHNDGINIAAPRGSPVRAAENGVVAYSGNELRGFGNLLLIKHAGGWISAYAHNGELLVSRGNRVRKGEPIARVGSSGNVSRPQLHFELRRGKQAIDPRKYLRDSNA